MIEQQSDILIEIPDNQLSKLANLYEKEATWAPYMFSFVKMAIEWKKTEKFREVLRIFSPKNSWAEDGTIVAIFQFKIFDVRIFTLDDNCTNLYEGLMKTELIDYTQRVLFSVVHEKHLLCLTDYLENKKINISFAKANYIYTLSPENAKNLTVEIPSEVYVKKLEPLHVKQLNEAWPHRYEGSEFYIATLIEINGGYGLFLKSTNELVSWILINSYAILGMLQTEENHKKRGYGSVITKILSKEIGERGFWSTATILQENQASIGMFEKMGFRSIGACTFIAITS